MAILNKNHLYHITKMVNDTNVQYFEKGEWVQAESICFKRLKKSAEN